MHYGIMYGCEKILANFVWVKFLQRLGKSYEYCIATARGLELCDQ